ncbi:hypothetical protein AVEN_144266-1, partial [Araneus ventricosus]
FSHHPLCTRLYSKQKHSPISKFGMPYCQVPQQSNAIASSALLLLNDEEIIAEVRHSPKEDEEEDDDEGQNDSHT